MKKKALILTLNDYIVYQPSILNLYDYMSPHFDVTIVSFIPDKNGKDRDESRNIIYLETKLLFRFFYSTVDFILANIFKRIKWITRNFEYSHSYYSRYLPYLLRSAFRKKKLDADVVIAVDLPALRVAQEMYGRVHFLSLEIDNNTSPNYKKIDRNKVLSVFIQSRERYDYLFPGMDIPVFFVQNAPVFYESYVSAYDRKGFIWSGSINPVLGIYECIDFFDAYPQYSLVIKGGDYRNTLQKIRKKYAHLIRENRIKLDQAYLPAPSFIDFLSRFRIGFAFYSWKIIHSKFNYATAPSGKLFMNLAAGVPVIACNIPGFKLVQEFEAGVLVDDYRPETILKAAQKIESDYERFRQGCYNAARHFSFDKGVKPYIDFLLKYESDKKPRPSAGKST
jgi:glycosyltransferase involved in cell wall biosynthesis